MTDIYKARWESAKKIVCDFKDMCAKNEVDVLCYLGDIIELDQIILEENEIYILHEDRDTHSSYRYMIFENDRDYSHGLEKTVKEFREEFLSSFKAYKQINLR